MAVKISDKLKKAYLRQHRDYGRLAGIVGPIAFQNLMNSLVIASDAVMNGFLGEESLSAVSLAGQVAFFHAMIVMAFVLGFNVLGAQYWGKKDEENVIRVMTVTMRYQLVIGLLFSVMTFASPAAVMRIFTADEEIIMIGAGYLRMVSVSYFVTAISQTLFGVLKVCDHARASSVIGSLSVILNIALNAVLIFGIGSIQGIGTKGAAAATVIARVFEAVLAMTVIVKNKCPHTGIKKLLGNVAPGIGKAYRTHMIPILIHNLGWGGGVTMYSVIMGHLGKDAVSSYTISVIVRTIIASLCWGVAAGSGIVIGGLLGSGELDEAKELGGKYLKLSIWVGIASGILILCLTPFVLRTAVLSEAAAGYLKVMLLIAAYHVIGNSFNSMIMTGILPAGGDTKFGMYCDLITVWCLVIPLSAIFAFILKAPVPVVAFILTLDEFAKMPAVIRQYRKYRWIRNLTNE